MFLDFSENSAGTVTIILTCVIKLIFGHLVVIVSLINYFRSKNNIILGEITIIKYFNEYKELKTLT
jgi:hypothetical protein